MGRVQDGLQDMQEASRDKAIDDHKVIDEAIRDRGEGYMVFSVVCSRFSLPPLLHPSSIVSSLSVYFTALPRRNLRMPLKETFWENL